MKLDNLRENSRLLWSKGRNYVMKTPERRWTAGGAVLATVVGSILVPPMGIVALGGGIAGWWIVVVMLTLFGVLIGNRVGIEVGRRQDAQRQKNKHKSKIEH